MKKLKEDWGRVILGALLPSLVVSVLNLVVAHFHDPVGRVVLGERSQINGQPFVQVHLRNYSSKTIDGVLIETSFDMAAATVSHPVSISRVSAFSLQEGRFIWSLGGLAPREISTITVPLSGGDQDPIFVVRNADEKNLDVTATDPGGRFVRDNLVRAGSDAGVYFLLLALFNYLFAGFVNRRMNDLRLRVKDAQKDVKRLDRERERLNGVLANITKTKIFYVSRISDLSKELAFWRSVIKQMVMRAEGGYSAEDLYELVTRSLKTFKANHELRFGVEEMSEFAEILRRFPGFPGESAIKGMEN